MKATKPPVAPKPRKKPPVAPKPSRNPVEKIDEILTIQPPTQEELEAWGANPATRPATKPKPARPSATASSTTETPAAILTPRPRPVPAPKPRPSATIAPTPVQESTAVTEPISAAQASQPAPRRRLNQDFLNNLNATLQKPASGANQ